MRKLKENRFKIYLAGILLLLGLTTAGMGQTVYPLTVKAYTSWDIGSDNNNNLYISWLSSGTLNFAKIINNAISGQQTVTTGVNTSKYCVPRLSVRPDGQSMSIVYVSLDQKSLMHAWRNSSGIWQNETIAGPFTDATIYYQAGAAGGDGTVHATYSLGKPYYRIYYSYKRNGGSWVSSIDLGDLDGNGLKDDNAEHARMVVDPNGGVHFSWMPYTPYIYYRYAANGAFLHNSVSQRIDGAGAYVMGNGSIAVTPNGTVHLSPHYARKIWHTSKPVGGTFSTEVCATNDAVGGTYELYNAIGVDSNGKVYISWAEYVDGVNSVKLSVYENRAWTVYTVDPLAKVGANSNNMPAIAMTSSAGYLLWRHNDDYLYLGEYVFNYLKVTSPNGGESMSPGSSQEINWTYGELTGNIKIELLKGTAVLGTIVNNLDIASSPYAWTAGHYLDATGAPKTAPLASDYSIKISTTDGAYNDKSDAYFSIAEDSISVTSPNGGESWTAGSSQTVTWTSSGAISNVTIEYSSNNGANWTTVIATTANDGSHPWTVPNTPSGQCLVRVSDATNASMNDVSNAVFTISESLVPAITITAPAGGALWQRGLTYAITWQKQGVQNNNVKINLYKGTGTLVKILSSGTENDGSFNWLVPAAILVGSTYYIRVQTVDGLVRDYSDKFSIIKPSIVVTSPVAGTVWTKGSARTITWNTIGIQNANVKIQLRKGTALISVLTLSTANDGSFEWTVPTTIVSSSLYKIRIITVDGLIVTTGNLFTITN